MRSTHGVDDPELHAYFLDSVVRLHDRTRDADLRSRIWDFRDGLIGRRELQADPRYQRELLAWYDDAFAARGIDPATVDLASAAAAESDDTPPLPGLLR